MSEEPIDRAVFAELKSTTGPEFAVELAQTFLEEAPGMIAEMRSAQAEGDGAEHEQRRAEQELSHASGPRPVPRSIDSGR